MNSNVNLKFIPYKMHHPTEPTTEIEEEERNYFLSNISLDLWINL